MRVCLKCGHENPRDLDFCESCGEYLRWEPTGIAAAVPAPPAQAAAPPAQAPAPAPAAAAPPPPAPSAPAAPPPPAPAAPAAPAAPEAPAAAPSGTRVYGAVTPGNGDGAGAAAPPAPPPARPDDVVVTLRLPEQESATGEEVAATVEAGGQATLIALVRNQSEIVDNYDLRVSGLPDDWWTITPSTVYLVPYGAGGGGYEQEVMVRLHPPRSAESEAREWPIRLVATSKARGAEAGSARAAVTVSPYQEFESELRPERASGRRKAAFAIAVRNKANAPVDVALAGLDPDNELAFEFEEQQLRIEPGRRAGTAFYVKPPKQIIIGRPVDRRFEVRPLPVGAEPGMARQGVFRQKPWLPWWLLILIPLLIVAAIAIWMLLPNNTTVPDLKGKDVFAAQQSLKDAGLELGEQTEKATGEAKPGTVLGQTPPAGEEVEKGSTVEIQVAVGTGRVKVPDLKGKTLAEADEELTKAKLTLGAIKPDDADPEKVVVVGQIPAAGAVKPEGSPVGVSVAEKESEAGKKAAGGGAPAPGGGDTPGGEGGGDIEVPNVIGMSTDEAATTLGDEGLALGDAVERFSADVEPGQIVTQEPAEGAKLNEGETVTVAVSIGYPNIAFDRNDNIFTMSGADGKNLKPLAESTDLESDPAWDPTGTLLAYRRGPDDDKSQIWVVNPDDPTSAHPVTNPGFDDGRPAFSPDGKVIAFARGRNDSADHDLCFIAATARAARPSCIADPDTFISRPTWSPDGKSILVVASQPEDIQVELLHYSTARANSGRQGDWVEQALVTDRMHGKKELEAINYAAWSPTGTQVAFVANWGTGVYRLFLLPVKGGKFGKPKQVAAVEGCELSWRPDGLELAVTRRNATCDETGRIVRVDPKNPDEQTVLTKTGVANPAYAPTAPE